MRSCSYSAASTRATIKNVKLFWNIYIKKKCKITMWTWLININYKIKLKWRAWSGERCSSWRRSRWGEEESFIRDIVRGDGWLILMKRMKITRKGQQWSDIDQILKISPWKVTGDLFCLSKLMNGHWIASTMTLFNQTKLQRQRRTNNIQIRLSGVFLNVLTNKACN